MGQGGPGFDQAIGLAVDVAMVQVGRGKFEFTRPDHRHRLPLRRIGCALADAHSHPKPTSVLYRALATTVRMHNTIALLYRAAWPPRGRSSAR